MRTSKRHIVLSVMGMVRHHMVLISIRCAIVVSVVIMISSARPVLLFVMHPIVITMVVGLVRLGPNITASTLKLAG